VRALCGVERPSYETLRRSACSRTGRRPGGLSTVQKPSPPPSWAWRPWHVLRDEHGRGILARAWTTPSRRKGKKAEASLRAFLLSPWRIGPCSPATGSPSGHQALPGRNPRLPRQRGFAACRLDEEGWSARSSSPRAGRAPRSRTGSLSRTGDVLVPNHPSGILEPSEADLGGLARGRPGVGSFIVETRWNGSSAWPSPCPAVDPRLGCAHSPLSWKKAGAPPGASWRRTARKPGGPPPPDRARFQRDSICAPRRHRSRQVLPYLIPARLGIEDRTGPGVHRPHNLQNSSCQYIPAVNPFTETVKASCQGRSTTLQTRRAEARGKSPLGQDPDSKCRARVLGEASADGSRSTCPSSRTSRSGPASARRRLLPQHRCPNRGSAS
jgi:hypothetical protein